MILKIKKNGVVQTLWNDSLDLHDLGDVTVERASSVEPEGTTESGQVIWAVRLAKAVTGFPVGHRIATSTNRQEAIQAEVEWLNKNYLQA